MINCLWRLRFIVDSPCPRESKTSVWEVHSYVHFPNWTKNRDLPAWQLSIESSATEDIIVLLKPFTWFVPCCFFSKRQWSENIKKVRNWGWFAILPWQRAKHKIKDDRSLTDSIFQRFQSDCRSPLAQIFSGSLRVRNPMNLTHFWSEEKPYSKRHSLNFH